MARFIREYGVPVMDTRRMWGLINDYWLKKSFQHGAYEGYEVWYQQCAQSAVMRYFTCSYTGGTLYVEAWTREAFLDGAISDEQTLDGINAGIHRQLFMEDISKLIAELNNASDMSSSPYGGFGTTQGGWYYGENGNSGTTPPPCQQPSYYYGQPQDDYYQKSQNYASPQDGYYNQQVNYEQAPNNQLQQVPYNNQQNNVPYSQPSNGTITTGFVFALISMVSLPCSIMRTGFIGISGLSSFILPIVALILLNSGAAKNEKSNLKTAGTILAILSMIIKILIVIGFLFH